MTTARKAKARTRRRYAATEKCQAILALWTERSSGTELCQQLGVTWNQLNLWQDQAMAGMLQALEPRHGVPCGNLPLSGRLQSLLERKSARQAMAEELPPSSRPSRQPPPAAESPSRRRSSGPAQGSGSPGIFRVRLPPEG